MGKKIPEEKLLNCMKIKMGLKKYNNIRKGEKISQKKMWGKADSESLRSK
jgi:hypothetical protein